MSENTKTRVYFNNKEVTKIIYNGQELNVVNINDSENIPAYNFDVSNQDITIEHDLDYLSSSDARFKFVNNTDDKIRVYYDKEYFSPFPDADLPTTRYVDLNPNSKSDLIYVDVDHTLEQIRLNVCPFKTPDFEIFSSPDIMVGMLVKRKVRYLAARHSNNSEVYTLSYVYQSNNIGYHYGSTSKNGDKVSFNGVYVHGEYISSDVILDTRIAVGRYSNITIPTNYGSWSNHSGSYRSTTRITTTYSSFAEGYFCVNNIYNSDDNRVYVDFHTRVKIQHNGYSLAGGYYCVDGEYKGYELYITSII